MATVAIHQLPHLSSLDRGTKQNASEFYDEQDTQSIRCREFESFTAVSASATYNGDARGLFGESSREKQKLLGHIPVSRKSHVNGQHTASESGFSARDQRSTYAAETKTCFDDYKDKFKINSSDSYSNNKSDWLLNRSLATKEVVGMTKSRDQTYAGSTSNYSLKLYTSDLKIQTSQASFGRTVSRCSTVMTGGQARDSLKRTASSLHPASNHTSRFETSELAHKLRGTVQSDFLNQQLRLDSTAEEEDPKGGETSSRTIEEILKSYGIEDKAAPLDSKVQSDRFDDVMAQYEAITSNVSQNNETGSAGKEGDGLANSSADRLGALEGYTGRNQDSAGPRPEEYVMGSNTASQRNAPATSSYKNNYSYNNDTATTNNPLVGEDDSLRKYGSSVDYGSAMASAAAPVSEPTKYSNNSGQFYGRYDYGRNIPVPGDTAAALPNTYTSMDPTSYETKVLSSNFHHHHEGSQVDIVKQSQEAVIQPNYEEARSLVSATDALEFTISSERQRLRKLDTMIKSTSMAPTAYSVPRPATTRFLSPQRDYHTYRPTTRVYSTPVLPSTNYSSGLANKSSWSGNVGLRDAGFYLAKSASVPGQFTSSYQPSGRYTSTTDTYSSYTPYRPQTKDYNFQYNNSSYYTPLVAEKFILPKSLNRNNQKKLINNVLESSDKAKNKKATPTSGKSQNSNQSRAPRKNCSGTSVQQGAKCTGSNITGNKKTGDNTNKDKASNSCSSNSLFYDYGGDFVRDLNNLYNQTKSNKSTTSNKAPQNHTKLAAGKPTGKTGPKNPSGTDLSYFVKCKDLFWRDTLQANSVGKNSSGRKLNNTTPPPKKTVTNRNTSASVKGSNSGHCGQDHHRTPKCSRSGHNTCDRGRVPKNSYSGHNAVESNRAVKNSHSGHNHADSYRDAQISYSGHNHVDSYRAPKMSYSGLSHVDSYRAPKMSYSGLNHEDSYKAAKSCCKGPTTVDLYRALRSSYSGHNIVGTYRPSRSPYSGHSAMDCYNASKPSSSCRSVTGSHQIRPSSASTVASFTPYRPSPSSSRDTPQKFGNSEPDPGLLSVSSRLYSKLKPYNPLDDHPMRVVDFYQILRTPSSKTSRVTRQ